jgi:hypothetical protein
MRHLSRCAPVFALLALVAVPAASAQGNPHAREGFWIGVGSGFGSVDFVCDTCANFDRESGLLTFLKAGTTVSPRTLVGVELAVWRKDISGSTVTVGQVNVAGSFYLRPQSGFFLKIGGGFSTYSSTNGGERSGLGGAFTLGAGYDIRVASNISLTPVVGYLHGDVDDIKVDGVTQDAAWRQSAFHIGLGVTFH